MTNQLTMNFSYRNYTNFDWDKLFLGKSSIMLLISHFYTPWKRQKTKEFLTFSGGIEMWNKKWVELMSKVSYAQGEEKISETITGREV